MDIIKVEDLKNTFAAAEAITAEAEEVMADLSAYRDKIVLVKPGGEVIEPEIKTSFDIKDSVLSDVALMKKLGVHPVLIHGGGKQISAEIEKAKKSGIPDIFNQVSKGIRIVNEAGLECSMGVGDRMRRGLTHRLTQIGSSANIRAVQVSGADIVKAWPMYEGMRTGTLGFEDFIEREDYEGLRQHIKAAVQGDYLRKIATDPNCVPVIDWHAGSAVDDGYFTVNADEMAVAVGVALDAERILFLSCDKQQKFRGVHNANGDLYSQLNAKEARSLIDQGIAVDGMAVKLQNSITAVNCGVKGVGIVNPSFKGAAKHELGAKTGAATLIIKDYAHTKTFVHEPLPVPAA